MTIYSHDTTPPGYMPCTREPGHDGPCALPLAPNNLMHTFDLAYRRHDGEVWVCNNCFEVRLLTWDVGAPTVRVLNPGVNPLCAAGVAYMQRRTT